MAIKIQKIIIIFLIYVHRQEAFRTRRSIEDDIWGIDDQSSTTETTTMRTCKCVPYYLCKNDTVITDGEGLLDIRLGSGCDGSYLNKCCKYEKPFVEPTPVPPVQSKGCGFRNSNGVGFKIKQSLNHEAEFGEFPWMTAVFEQTKEDSTFQCGGALIHPEVVLTAAHCVKNKGGLTIRAGEWDTQTTKEQYPFQNVDVASVVIHPQFNTRVLFNDIALLFLKKPVKLAPHINVVCLPPSDTVFEESRCYSSGWGKTEFERQGALQVILKKIDLPMVPRDHCQSDLRKTKLGSVFQLHPSFVCAGGEEGKDTCTGDGGSPLVCPIEGHVERYFQVGIVAWGVGCGNKNVPGVYVNVATFRKWIDEQMQERNFDISSYEVS